MEKTAAREVIVVRFEREILWVALGGCCWLGMMAVHEAGHVLGACLTGGEISRVVWHPLAVSRTELSHNPAPLAVAWAGPLFGALAPLAAWAVAASWRMPLGYLLRAFAGFCLIVNGGYLIGDAFYRLGDAGDLLRHGAAVWQLLLFGAPAFAAGIWLWNGQGERFGLGHARGKVDRTATLAVAASLALLVVAGFLFGSR